MTSINNIINKYLCDKRVSKEEFDDFKVVVEQVGDNKKILDWFTYLHSVEIPGWRPKLVTKKIITILSNATKENPIQFYALFCPSYIKGESAHGFRTDDVGTTSLVGIDKLQEIVSFTKEIGFPCSNPHAIFFDIALEQPEKTIYQIDDLKINVNNFKKHLPEDFEFSLLSELFPFLFDIIGYNGIKISPLPVPETVLKRIVERGRKFYELFGWSEEKINERSEVIASSEAMAGSAIRYLMPNSIMIYTPTMLERAQVYSGHKFNTDPLPIIFPSKD